MKKLYLFVVILAATAVGCKKTGSGNGGGGSDSGTFQPTTSGSTWSYAVTENFNAANSLLLSAAEADTALHLVFPVIDTSYTLNVTATTTDTTVGGVSYTVLQANGPTGNLLVAPQDTLYWGLGVVPEFEIPGLGGTVSPQPFLYLKDGPVGESWAQTVYGPSPLGGQDTIYYNMSITAVNQTVTVSGQTFTGVTEETVSVLPGGITALESLPGIPQGVSLAVSGTFYYARNIGLIEVNIFSGTFGFSYTEMLTSYNIK